MGTATTILIFILVLSVLVFVHELGHFVAAKLFGIRVDEFGFGFPPRIFGKTIKGTLYSLNWIPVGGFVKIKGVAGDDKDLQKNEGDSDSFANRPFYKKFIILFAGILMNGLLAVLLFTITFVVGVAALQDDVQPGGTILESAIIVSAIVPEGSAAQVGLQIGDAIQRINEEEIESSEALQEYTSSSADKTLTLEVKRDKEVFEVDVIPKKVELDGYEYIGIGVGFQEVVKVRYSWYQALWMGTTTTGQVIAEIGIALVGIMKSVFTTGSVGEDVAGPVGIAVLTGQFARMGFIPLLQFTALLSVNLAIFNFLPIPALDGGRLIFVVLERIRRKPVNQQIEAMIHNIGFILLLIFVLLITLKDVSQYNLVGYLRGFFS
ncbi:MAG: RIP metalloprotease RseP [Candidatus Kerfeldbacteria bacterium]